jgi:hypothetical protein
MKKLLLVAAIVALVAALAVPVIAQVRNHPNNWNWNDPNRWNWNNPNWNNNDGFGNGGGVSQGIANESESGNVTPSFSVTSSGDNSNQCVTPLQFGNTGNLNNAQGFLQYASNSGDLEAEGPSFTFAPQLNGRCNQQVQQSSAASSQ